MLHTHKAHIVVVIVAHKLSPPSQLDIVLIPYCNGIHWTLLVINVALKRFEYYDSLGGCCSPRLLEGVKVVFNTWGAASNQEAADTWPVLDMHSRGVAPRQLNGVDCGIFVMRVAEHLVRGASLLDVTQANMPWLRKLTVLELKEGK